MRWTDDEIEALCAAYKAAPVSEMLDLDRLAKLFNRHKTNVCRKARELGLTDQTRKKHMQRRIVESQPVFATPEERAAATSKRIKEHQATHGHPRGMLGKRHSPETRARISETSKAMWSDPSSKINSEQNRQRLSDNLTRRIASGVMNEGYTRTRGGRRADLGDRYFRSSWEANYARYLNWLRARGEIAGWEFECKTFVFEAIKRGTRAYTPDFKVIRNDGGHEWHEVKGWMDAKSRTRLDRMARYYPEEKVVIVGTDWFRATNRGPLPGLIPNWEHGNVR